MMITLGINGIDKIFHDASATIVRGNEVVASVEEERSNRKKHSDGVPFDAIEFCLRKAGVSTGQIDHIGYYFDPVVLKKVFVDDVVSTQSDHNHRKIWHARCIPVDSRPKIRIPA